MTDELTEVQEVAPDTEGTPDASTDTEGEATGTWPKEVQAEFTKKSQALADERRDFQSQQQNWQQQQSQQQQQYQQQQQQLQHYAQQMQQQKGTQGQQAQTQLLDQLRGMSYLDGPTAAQLMERIINEGINPLNTAIQQRDQALTRMYQEYKSLKEGLGQQSSKTAEAELSSRFQKVRDDQGLPDEPWVNDYLQDVYYSHEGNDLNTEYPGMVRERLDTMRKGFRAMDQKAAKAAKGKSPFPGKGGEISFADGKTGGYKSPQDRADELWPMINPGLPSE
jgi:exonuclease VII large subunit